MEEKRLEEAKKEEQKRLEEIKLKKIEIEQEEKKEFKNNLQYSFEKFLNTPEEKNIFENDFSLELQNLFDKDSKNVEEQQTEKEKITEDIIYTYIKISKRFTNSEKVLSSALRNNKPLNIGFNEEICGEFIAELLKGLMLCEMPENSKYSETALKLTLSDIYFVNVLSSLKTTSRDLELFSKEFKGALYINYAKIFGNYLDQFNSSFKENKPEELVNFEKLYNESFGIKNNKRGLVAANFNVDFSKIYKLEEYIKNLNQNKEINVDVNSERIIKERDENINKIRTELKKFEETSKVVAVSSALSTINVVNSKSEEKQPIVSVVVENNSKQQNVFKVEKPTENYAKFLAKCEDYNNIEKQIVDIKTSFFKKKQLQGSIDIIKKDLKTEFTGLGMSKKQKSLTSVEKEEIKKTLVNFGIISNNENLLR